MCNVEQDCGSRAREMVWGAESAESRELCGDFERSVGAVHSQSGKKEDDAVLGEVVAITAFRACVGRVC
jgi:hypothetical protein